MDNDLERSVRLLEDAITPTGSGLFRKTLSKKVKDQILDFSLTIKHSELHTLLNEDKSICNETMDILMKHNTTLTGSVVQSTTAPWKNTMDSLFIEFFEILQGYSGGHDVLEIIADLSRCCTDALSVITGLKSKVALKNIIEEEIQLLNERNTWSLILILYQDRLLTKALMDDNAPEVYSGLSEKLCIETLFKHDNLIRESQLIIDWLESNARDSEDLVLHFADGTIGWENTLHQLKMSESIAFSSQREIVSNMDPDAPHYQNLPLHDLDVQDYELLCQKCFRLIRCGQLEEAQEICINSGHPWKAALLEGWRLFHNPNIKEDKKINEESEEETEKCVTPTEQYLETEGNPSRDIWKVAAWRYCQSGKLGLEERAAIAAYCGCAEALLPVCHSWEDTLWAYVKTMVDIRVESEIRDNVNRKYVPLPENYWNQRMSLNDIFKQLESSKNIRVKTESVTPDHIIQKYIILDEIPVLIQLIEDWIQEPTVPTYFLRFLSHLVLFFDQIGEAHNREIVEEVLEAYTKRLMDMNETKLVAFYASKVGPKRQVQQYAAYLERIIDTEERKEALEYAESFGLNVLIITKQVVENIRNRPKEIEAPGNLMTKLTEADLLQVSAIEWVTFYDEQLAEALFQSNAIIFTFLTLSKVDAAQLAFNKIPSDTVEKLLPNESNQNVRQAIKEHLSYKAYLEAYSAFNEWYQQHKNKPQPPEDVSDTAQFTEKVAHQHRVSQFKAETERWKLKMSHLVKSAKTLLYNVLLFPEGWLTGAKDADYLRSNCIPEVVLLLFKVLFESGLHAECVQLTDILASERYGLYKVYSKEKLGEILVKLSESSLALLNAKKDPWGYETSA